MTRTPDTALLVVVAPKPTGLMEVATFLDSVPAATIKVEQLSTTKFGKLYQSSLLIRADPQAIRWLEEKVSSGSLAHLHVQVFATEWDTSPDDDLMHVNLLAYDRQGIVEALLREIPRNADILAFVAGTYQGAGDARYLTAQIKLGVERIDFAQLQEDLRSIARAHKWMIRTSRLKKAHDSANVARVMASNVQQDTPSEAENPTFN